MCIFFVQIIESKCDEVLARWCLQKPRPPPVWWPWCWRKGYYSLRWRPGLHGSYQEIARVSGQGDDCSARTYLHSSKIIASFIYHDHLLSKLGYMITFSRLNFGFGACLLILSSTFQVRTIVKPGCSQDVLKAALSAMSSVTEILSVMASPSSNANTPF